MYKAFGIHKNYVHRRQANRNKIQKDFGERALVSDIVK